jgi:hypothetical protein
MIRALALASLVVAVSLGVLELSARTETAKNFSAEGFRAERVAGQTQLTVNLPLLPR